MPSPYRAIFAAPGSKGFSAAGLLGRMPLSMMGIGVVTMISQRTGRYGLAGALTATLAMAARSSVRRSRAWSTGTASGGFCVPSRWSRWRRWRGC